MKWNVQILKWEMMKCSFNKCKLLLSAIPLGICEKARPVNTGSQKHVSKTVKNAEKNHHLNFVPVCLVLLCLFTK